MKSPFDLEPIFPPEEDEPAPAERAEADRSDVYAYDKIAYLTEPTPRTNPAHIGGISALYGLKTPPANSARVLEVGCGSGSNLLSIAAAHPGCSVVGIDLSESAIAEARIAAAELGLTNCRFELVDLEKFEAPAESFDYIIAHGLFSWVPAATQRSLLALTAKLLSSNGAAFISFNTLPGWYMRGMFREMALFHLRDITDPQQRIKLAREILTGLQKYGRSEDGFDTELIRLELGQILKMPDWYLFHDLLEQNNQPCYFAEFIEQLGQNGLQYLADAEPQKNEPMDFPDEARRFLVGLTDDRNGFEQYADFFRLRMFRRAIVCRDSAALSMPDRKRLEAGGLYLASAVKAQPGFSPSEPIKYIAPNGGGLVISQRWMQAVMNNLIAHWPASVAIEELLFSLESDPEKKSLAAKTLLDGFYAGVIEITREPQPVALETKNPCVFSPARLFSRRGMIRVGNVRHDLVSLPAPVAALLPVLDGAKDRAALEADFSAFAPLLSPEDAKAFGSVDQILDFLRDSSLLV